VLPRVASQPLSDFFAAYHRKHGVDILTGAAATAIDAGAGAITLADGRVIEGGVILVGVGAVACDVLATSAGLKCDGGIVVDGEARTSDPSVYAIGDCTHRPLPLYGATMRLESVPNALEQAKQAAASICGRPAPAPEVPWFWSDQYDLKLQIAGVSLNPDRLVVRGSVDDAKFAVFHLKDRRIIAVEAANAPAEFMGGKQLIAKAVTIDPVRLADASIPMKALMS